MRILLLSTNGISGILLCAAVCAGVQSQSADAVTYDAQANYEVGWISAQNPNGVWSYGYSSSALSSVTLYNVASLGGGINGGNEQFWLSSSVNSGDSPSVGFNNGPAISNGNINFLQDDLILAAGIGGQYTDVVFTAPAAGSYSLTSDFRGDQNGVGTLVGVTVNSSAIFSSSVTSVGEIVPFDTVLHLNSGDKVDFSVGPGGGLQNTGLSATFAVVPEPASMGLITLAASGLLGRRRVRGFPQQQR